MEGLLGKSIGAFLSQPRQQEPQEIIQTLCNRLQHSTNLEDRRAAVLGLRGFSRDYQAIVGQESLEALNTTVKRDFHDPETLRAALETLLVVFMYEDHPSPAARVALQKLQDAYIKDPDNILMLLDCLESSDFYSRLYALQLLSNLLKARPVLIQKCLLSSALGISRLVASLNDKREAVRNETLLVLIGLTEGNPEIQKLVAFENAFEILFVIIEQEGGVDGGIVVQDCLQLLATLLRYNSSNQNYFRETRGVPRLVGVFPSGDNAGHWPQQRARNTILSLGIARILISKGGAGTINNQEALAQAGAMNKIIDLSLSLDPPSTVSASALLACADLLRGNYKIQVYFSTFLVPGGPLCSTPQVSRTSTPSGHKRSSSHPQRSSSHPKTLALDALIAMSLTSTAPYTYDQRLAACQCIQGFIHSNPEGRQGILQRIITTHHDDTENVKPSNLLNFILNLNDSTRKDPYRIWFACIILLHLVDSSPPGKALVRGITIGDVESGEEVVSALQQINANLSSCLINSYDPRIAVGYLMLLCIWLYDDPASVSEFLDETAGIQTLVGTVAQAREGVFVTGLAAVLLGICVEFNTVSSALPPYSPGCHWVNVIRASLQKLIVSGVGGKDQLVFRITQFRETSEFRDFREQVTFSSNSDNELPDLWFDLGFVEFLKDNYSIPFRRLELIVGRIQRSLERSPESFDVKQNGIIEKTVSTDQSKYVNSLEIRLKSSENDVKSKEAQLLTLRSKLDKQIADHEKERIRAETAEKTVKSTQAELAHFKSQLEEAESKAKSVQGELDDLLLVLGEMEDSATRYKQKIKSLGGEITDDDNEDDEE